MKNVNNKQKQSGSLEKGKQQAPIITKTQTFDQQMLKQIQCNKRLSMFTNIQEKAALHSLYSNFEKLSEEDKFQLLLKVLKQPLLIRNAQEINVIIYYIQHIEMLKRLQKHDKKILEKSAQTIEFQNYQKGEIVFQFGTPADYLYFILSGKIAVLIPKNQHNFNKESEINIQTEQKKEYPNVQLFADIDFYSKDLIDKDHFYQKNTNIFRYIFATVKGINSHFGEMGLLNNQNRNATILAIQDTQMLKISKQYYQSLFKHIELTKFEKKMKFLQECLKFEFKKSDLEKITNMFIQKKIKLDKNEFIFKEGDPANQIYLIIQGEIQVMKKHKIKQFNISSRKSLLNSVDDLNSVLQSPGKNHNTISINIGIIGKHEFLGVYDILKQRQKHDISAKCIQKTKIYILNKELFEKLIIDVPQLQTVLEKRAESQKQFIDEKFETAIKNQQDPNIPSIYQQKLLTFDLKTQLEQMQIESKQNQNVEQQHQLQSQQQQSRQDYYQTEILNRNQSGRISQIRASQFNQIQQQQLSSNIPRSSNAGISHMKTQSQDFIYQQQNIQNNYNISSISRSQNYGVLKQSNSQEKINSQQRNDFRLNKLNLNENQISQFNSRIPNNLLLTDRSQYNQKEQLMTQNYSTRQIPAQQGIDNQEQQKTKLQGLDKNIEPFMKQFWANFDDVQQQLQQNLIKVHNQRAKTPKKQYIPQKKQMQQQQLNIQTLIRKLYKPNSTSPRRKKDYQQTFCMKKELYQSNPIEDSKKYQKIYYINNLFNNNIIQQAAKGIQTITEHSIIDNKIKLKTIN